MHTGLFLELPAGCRQQVFSRFGHALRDGPGTDVAPFPEGTARMRQKQFQTSRCATVQ
jgi:hypothetical protein